MVLNLFFILSFNVVFLDFPPSVLREVAISSDYLFIIGFVVPDYGDSSSFSLYCS